jgi:hypothetical protein
MEDALTQKQAVVVVVVVHTKESQQQQQESERQKKNWPCLLKWGEPCSLWVIEGLEEKWFCKEVCVGMCMREFL